MWARAVGNRRGWHGDHAITLPSPSIPLTPNPFHDSQTMARLATPAHDSRSGPKHSTPVRADPEQPFLARHCLSRPFLDSLSTPHHSTPVQPLPVLDSHNPPVRATPERSGPVLDSHSTPRLMTDSPHLTCACRSFPALTTTASPDHSAPDNTIPFHNSLTEPVPSLPILYSHATTITARPDQPMTALPRPSPPRQSTPRHPMTASPVLTRPALSLPVRSSTATPVLARPRRASPFQNSPVHHASPSFRNSFSMLATTRRASACMPTASEIATARLA